ncbi:hypothetical protein CLV69_109202 [Amycolatopsis arida]|nr:hypothetical protein CLV69_109202 [Amycolatopsis arida]
MVRAICGSVSGMEQLDVSPTGAHPAPALCWARPEPSWEQVSWEQAEPRARREPKVAFGTEDVPKITLGSQATPAHPNVELAVRNVDLAGVGRRGPRLPRSGEPGSVSATGQRYWPVLLAVSMARPESWFFPVTRVRM